MRTTRPLRLCLLLVLMSPTSQQAFAETSAEQLKQRIQARSQRIAEFRALLNDPDQTVRLAALDEMLGSDDVAMRELAFGVCFNSADQAMRAICLRRKFADLGTINVEFPGTAGQEWSASQLKVLQEWGGTYTFSVTGFDPKTGRFKTIGTYRNGKGQLSGTRLTFKHPYCAGSFALGDGAVLEGELGCTSSWAGTFKGVIRLQ